MFVKIIFLSKGIDSKRGRARQSAKARLTVLAGAAFAALLTFVLLTRLAYSSEVTLVTFDGVWWQSLGEHEKFIAVEGMSAGYDAGYQAATARAAVSLAQGTTLMKRLIDVRPNHGDRTFGKMVEILNDVYENHPDLAKVRINAFIDCAETSGKNCNYEIEYWESQTPLNH